MTAKGKPQVKWTAQEVAFLRDNADTPRADLLSEFFARFRVVSRRALDAKLGRIGVYMDTSIKGAITGSGWNKLPIGTITRQSDGWLYVKTAEGWRPAHSVNWELANGPVPARHRLMPIDGDRENVAAENWRPIPFGAVAALTLHGPMALNEAPREVRPALIALAELKHEIKQKGEEDAEC